MDFIIIILALIITLTAQIFVKISYSKYLKIQNNRKLTGEDAAKMILSANGLDYISVRKTSGMLTDYYDPSNKVVCLSESNFNSTSVAAVSVASHECGHAIQHKDGYKFMLIRSKLVPIVNFSSYAGYIAIVFGCIFSIFGLIWLGIIFECCILLFQLVTLPVEFNASNRALKEIKKYQLLDNDEIYGAKRVLKAAAMTYVASVANAMLQILRLVLVFGRRRD